MKRYLLAILLACVLLAGCAARQAPQAAPEPEPLSAPSAAEEKSIPDTAPESEKESPGTVSAAGGTSAQGTEPVELNDRLLRELSQRIKNEFEDDTRPAKGLGVFIEQNERFTSYPNAQMMWSFGLDSDIYRFDRINRFFEAHQAGKPGALYIVQSGEPIPCFVVELVTDGKTLTVRFVWSKQFPEPRAVVLEETDTEWIIPGDDERNTLRYAKYGLIPLLIGGEVREVTRDEAQKLIYNWAVASLEWLPEDFALHSREDEAVAGEICWVYSDAQGGNVFAITPDLSFLYSMEQVGGNYVPELIPAVSEQAAKAAKLPSGQISRIRNEA